MFLALLVYGQRKTCIQAFHICSLPNTSLAFQVKEIQERLTLPSLRDEIVGFLNRFEVVDIKDFTKKSWKSFVDEKVSILNREFILNECKNYKKVDYLSLSCEEFGLMEYFSTLNLADSRIKFKERCNTMTGCLLSYPSNIEYIRLSFSCPQCGEVDSLTFHWKPCLSYASLRHNRNLLLDSDLVGYYRDIIRLREEQRDN